MANWRRPFAANELETSYVWIKWEFAVDYFFSFFIFVIVFKTSIFPSFELGFWVQCLFIDWSGSSNARSACTCEGVQLGGETCIFTKFVCWNRTRLLQILFWLFDSQLFSFWCYAKSATTFDSYHHSTTFFASSSQFSVSREKKKQNCFFLLHLIVLNVNSSKEEMNTHEMMYRGIALIDGKSKDECCTNLDH